MAVLLLIKGEEVLNLEVVDDGKCARLLRIGIDDADATWRRCLVLWIHYAEPHVYEAAAQQL